MAGVLFSASVFCCARFSCHPHTCRSLLLQRMNKYSSLIWDTTSTVPSISSGSVLNKGLGGYWTLPVSCLSNLSVSHQVFFSLFLAFPIFFPFHSLFLFSSPFLFTGPFLTIPPFSLSFSVSRYSAFAESTCWKKARSVYPKGCLGGCWRLVRWN